MSAILPSSSNDSATAREARVDAAIAEFLQAAEAGRAPSLTEFLAQHADIAAELREFLVNDSAFRQFSASLLGEAKGSRGVIQSEQLPRPLGEFELLRVIGRGGMGVIYQARRLADDTHVAIKLLHPWLALDVTSLQRFQREADAAASLRHPNMIPVLGIGTADGTPFLVMPLIDGESLDQFIRRGHSFNRNANGVRADGPAIVDGRSTPAPMGVGLNEIAAVADALQHAHERGVIHRDVKPSNLLLTRDGRLLIGDFGLARMTQQPSLTRTGEAVGSPAYMSPEQIAARGDGEPIDHRTDIYSLGATLYEILTGRPPFVADSRERLLASIQDDDPIPLRQLEPRISRDLETICLKCLRKNPGERYSTAAELAADLRRAAQGEAIRALRSGVMTRLRRWVARRESARMRLFVLATCVLVTISVSAIAWNGRRTAINQQRQQAIDSALVVALTGDLKATDDAIAKAERVGVSRGWLDLLRGQVAFHRGDYSSAIEYLESAEASSRKPTVSTVALKATAALAAGSWEKYEIRLDQAEALTPATAEDFLFLGEAESYFIPHKAVRSLNEAIRRRDTPLARLVRAEARANLAFDTNDLAMAEAALADAFIASDLLPDHPAALLESMNAHLVAAELWADSGRLDRRDDELAAAEKLFQSLDPFQHLPTVVHNRALFLLLTNRAAESLELLRESTALHRDPLVAYDFALALFREGNADAALGCLNSRMVGREQDVTDNLTADEAFLRVLLLQETRQESAAIANYDRLAIRYQTGLTSYFRPCLLLLLGQPERATEEYLAMLATGVSPRLRTTFYSRLIAFNGGQLAESEFLDGVRGSRWNRCEALFFTGLRRLATGDRPAAKKLFEQCVATRCAGFLSWDWSHAILRRWDNEPNWPLWIK